MLTKEFFVLIMSRGYNNYVLKNNFYCVNSNLLVGEKNGKKEPRKNVLKDDNI